MQKHSRERTLLSKDVYGPHFEEHLMGQYRIMTDSLQNEKTQFRRSHRFFILLNQSTIFFSLFLLSWEPLTGNQILLVGILAVLGLLLSMYWREQIQGFQSNIKVKREILHRLEERLPFPPFQEESKRLSQLSSPQKRKFQLPLVSPHIPYLLAIPYAGIILYICIYSYWVL